VSGAAVWPRRDRCTINCPTMYVSNRIRRDRCPGVMRSYLMAVTRQFIFSSKKYRKIAGLIRRIEVGLVVFEYQHKNKIVLCARYAFSLRIRNPLGLSIVSLGRIFEFAASIAASMFDDEPGPIDLVEEATPQPSPQGPGGGLSLLCSGLGLRRLRLRRCR